MRAKPAGTRQLYHGLTNRSRDRYWVAADMRSAPETCGTATRSNDGTRARHHARESMAEGDLTQHQMTVTDLNLQS